MKNYNKKLQEIVITMKKSRTDEEVFKIENSSQSAAFFRKQFETDIDIYESVMILYLNNSSETIA